MNLVRARRETGAGAHVAALLPDLIGLVGYGLVCLGIYRLWGAGWTQIAAGLPLIVIYVWRELTTLRSRSRRE